MASTHKHIRSGTANKRPTTAIAEGQIALATNITSPGLFFKDSTGATIVKIGPVHVGATAPNVSPAGSAGNSIGEVWLDTSLTPVGVKIWDGSAFVNATPIGSTTVQGLLELATDAETQAGADTARAVTSASLQSKLSDSTSTTSNTTIASSTAVKAAYDLANAALPKTGGTVTGNLEIGTAGSLSFEGATADGFETTIAITDPTADRTITLPNITGTVVTTGDSGTVTSTMILDGTIVDADINASAEISVSKLVDGSARQLLQTDAAGTGVEWASNIDIPGTLDVTSAATFDSTVTIAGDLTVNGTTTNINTVNLTVEDKNIIIGDVATPTDITADGGGITLKGTTDKTINWVDATDAWTLSEHVNIASAKEYRIAGTKVLDATSLGSAVVSSSLTSVGTIGTGVWQGTAITDTYLATIATAGKVSNSATTATSASTASAIVARDASGNFTAGTITAALTGAASSNVLKAGDTMTGALVHPLGAVGTPSITFTGDLNTGIYSPGADQVAVATNGVQRINIEADGDINIDGGGVFYDATNNRLAIGTTSPGYLLDVAGSARLGAATGDVALEVGAGASANRNAVIDFVGDTTYTDYGLRIIRTNGGANADSKIQHRGTGALVIEAQEAASTTFFNGGSERARIDSSGRLLVGTSTAFGTAYVQVQGSSANATDPGTVFLRRGYTSTEIASFLGTVLGQVDFGSKDGGLGARISSESDGTWSSTSDYPSRLVLATTADGAASPTERMRIDNAGFTNTFSSNNAFAARSSIGAGTTVLLYGGYYSATSTTSGTNSYVVWTNGNVVNTNNSYGAISDIKLKENIVDANSQWDDLKALQVRNYNFKEGQTHTQIGLVAQEVEFVSPGLVTESPDRDTEGNDLGTVTKSVNYSVLYMKAVKALQEAMERIEALEADVAQLKGA